MCVCVCTCADHAVADLNVYVDVSRPHDPAMSVYSSSLHLSGSGLVVGQYLECGMGDIRLAKGCGAVTWLL